MENISISHGSNERELENNKEFPVQKFITELTYIRYKCIAIQLSVDALLSFNYDYRLIKILIDFGFEIKPESFYDDLMKIKSVNETLKAKLTSLPKDLSLYKDEDYLAAYSIILNRDFVSEKITSSEISKLQLEVFEKLNQIPTV
jgi:hypothetical protein